MPEQNFQRVPARLQIESQRVGEQRVAVAPLRPAMDQLPVKTQLVTGHAGDVNRNFPGGVRLELKPEQTGARTEAAAGEGDETGGGGGQTAAARPPGRIIFHESISGCGNHDGMKRPRQSCSREPDRFRPSRFAMISSTPSRAPGVMVNR
ncbi:hypothetical protein SDC9_85513 [bioreactor metagenome]|uniref:Uncharacterized protein n=1 Tax=bioreactor metagenome TaxID=1076179 RepID=A0A644ZDE5_9ZZZZ